MNRLDHNDSLVLMRILANVERSVATRAIRLARVSLKNDRQFDEFQRSLREAESHAKATMLKAAQDLGFVDADVTLDELKQMR